MRANKLLHALLATALLSWSCGGDQKKVGDTTLPGGGGTGTGDVVGGGVGGGGEVKPVEDPKPVDEPPPPVLAFPEDDFRTSQPGAGAPRPLQLPTINKFKLPSGVEVYLAESHTLPVVSMSLVVETGTVGDPAGKEGLSDVCASTMGDSTQVLNKLALAEALADMASSVWVSGGGDQQFAGFATLSKHLEPTADLFAEVMLRPGMRQEDFDRNVKNAKVSLKQAKSSAPGVSGLVWPSVWWGPNHPYGKIESDASLSAISLDDCKKWSTGFKPGGAKLFVVGDIDKAGVTALFGKRFAGWKGKAPAAKKPPKPATRKGKIFFIDVPGSAQSVVTMAHPGPERKNKDFFALSVVSDITGGSFSSRLNMNLREKNGYTYGARGTFNYTRWYGMFAAGASVRADVTDLSIIEMYNEIAGVATGEITEEEMTRSKNDRILGLPADFETANDVLGAFRSLVYYGLPLDYFKSYVQNIEKVTLKAVSAAAKKYLKPKDLVVFVVGDGASVLPKLQQLMADKKIGEGELIVLDVDGNVVK